MSGKGTIRGRESFMANVAGRLGRQEPLAEAPAHPYRGAPDFYKAVALNGEEQIELFRQNWTALTGRVLVASAAEAPEKLGAWLLDIAAEHGVRRVSRWEHDGLRALGFDAALAGAGIEVVPWRPSAEGDGGPAAGERAAPPEAAPAASGPADLRDGGPGLAAAPEAAAGGSRWARRSELLRRTERCQLGLVWPDFAVANTGTLVLTAAPWRGRSVSLLPDILFAVFRADQLVTRMGEAFARIAANAEGPLGHPSSLNLITGPSRSADIENDLTIGIHGPGKVYAAIIK